MKKIISAFLAAAMILMFVPALSFASDTPSSWAAQEVRLAEENGLITSALKRDYAKVITREEFCELVVKLYEKLRGTKAEPSEDIFEDTDNIEILKAYKAGIVKGVSAVQFDPTASITRQELCVMLTRCVEHAIDTSTVYTYTINNFADGDQISDWAFAEVNYSYDHDIIHGIGENKISPLGTVTSEEAILIVIRMYLNRDSYEGETIETEGQKSFDSRSSLVSSVDVKCRSPYDLGGVAITDVTKYEPILSASAGSLGTVINITGKYGVNTLKNVDVTMEYRQNMLSGSDEGSLGVARYDESLGRMVLIEDVSVDKKNNTISFTDTSLGEYTIVDKDEWYQAWSEPLTELRQEMPEDTMAYYDVVFLVDDSGSMETNDPENVRATAVYEFIRSLSSGDGFAVESFTESTSENVGYTTVRDVGDWKELQNRISSLSSNGGTDISGAIEKGISILDGINRDTDKMIVLLTDGKQDSKSANYDENAAERAAERGYEINVISLGDDIDTDVLTGITEVTGGDYYPSEYADSLIGIYKEIKGENIGWSDESLDGDQLPDILEKKGMRNQYGIFIRSDNTRPDTDFDNLTDDEEMGERVVDSSHVTTQDVQNGITAYVYYIMRSDPNFKDSDYDGLNDDIDQFPLRADDDNWEEITGVEDRILDSNNDGISDYYTNLLYKGYLTSTTGVSFAGYNFGGPDDYDGDGLKNGEELIITEANGRIYAQMLSDPRLKNSDGDEYDDLFESINNTDPLSISLLNSEVMAALDSDMRAASQYLMEIRDNEAMQTALFASNYIFGSNYDRVQIYKEALLDLFEDMRAEAEQNDTVSEMVSITSDINSTIKQGIRIAEYEEYFNAPDKIAELEKKYSKLEEKGEQMLRYASPDSLEKYTKEMLDIHDEITKQKNLSKHMPDIPIDVPSAKSNIDAKLGTLDVILQGGELIYNIAKLNANARSIKENINILEMLSHSSDPALSVAAAELKPAAESDLARILNPIADLAVNASLNASMDLLVEGIAEAAVSSSGLWVVLIRDIVDLGMGVSETGSEALQTIALAQTAEMLADSIDSEFERNTALFQSIDEEHLEEYYQLLNVRKEGEKKYLELRDMALGAKIVLFWKQGEYEEAKAFCDNSIANLDRLIDKFSPYRIKMRKV